MKRHRALVPVALALAVLGAGAAAAQEKSPPAKKQRIVRSGKTVYDFEEADIMGALKRPEGQAIVEAPENRFRRLLDLDESFVPNIVRSVDEF
jgi:hypothetical protein